MTFRIVALPLRILDSVIEASDADLAAIGATRVIAEKANSAPCRVSLVDAEPGEALILLNHRHLNVPLSPYRADGPIFVREKAVQAVPMSGEVPDMLARRLLSARVYDADWMMIDADVIEGSELRDRLVQWFRMPAAVTVHLHTARRGCFMAAALRD